MPLRTALTFGSPSSIRLISDANVRPSPLRICFMALPVIRPSYNSKFNRRERKERIKSLFISMCSLRLLSSIFYYGRQGCGLTPTPSLHAPQQFPRDHDPLNL